MASKSEDRKDQENRENQEKREERCALVSNIYNGRNWKQSVYDHYNNFMFSEDKHVFFKMVKRIELFLKVQNLPGDIVECGVFKGSGMMVWLKLLKMFTPHDIRKVIGFDFFDQSFVETIPDKIDKEAMRQVFTRCQGDISKEAVETRFKNADIDATKFELIQGDITKTSVQYVKERPGMRISLLYMDLDLEEPTYKTLEALWDRVLPGGIVVFDEYGYHIWSESNAVDKFIREKGLYLQKINLQSPTAYIIKRSCGSCCPMIDC